MGSSSLNAEVNALERLQIVRGRNSSYFGSKYRSCTVRAKCFGASSLPSANASLMTALAVTSVNSLRCHASTCFRMGSKFRCIRSTPTEMQSIRENDFECFASTGVNTLGTMLPNWGQPVSRDGRWCQQKALTLDFFISLGPVRFSEDALESFPGGT